MTAGGVVKLSVVDPTNATIINQQAALLKKPARSRVDYNFFNYCSQCSLKLSTPTHRYLLI
jgi:hypothetical protein